MLKIFALVILFTACASSGGEWKRVGVAKDKEEWRYCHKDVDLPELHNKGICFGENWCRKKLFKDECERRQNFCAWGDIPCLELNKYPPIKRRLN